MRRAGPYLETEISLFCRRVSNINVNDIKKLKRVLSLVKETISDKIIIGLKIPIDMYTWIDAAYGVHINMRSHTGRAISMIHGMLHQNVGEEVE